jgi:hypothetical protein
LKNTLKVLNELKEKGLIKDYAIGGSDSGFEMDRAFFYSISGYFYRFGERSG